MEKEKELDEKLALESVYYYSPTGILRCCSSRCRLARVLGVVNLRITQVGQIRHVCGFAMALVFGAL